MSSIRYLWFNSKDEAERQRELRRMYWEQFREDQLDRVKKDLEKALEIEMSEAIQAGMYERTPTRIGYRGGYRYRDLQIWGGRLCRIKVPKRERGYKYKLLEPYSRRIESLSEAIYRAYVCGMSDRKVSKYFERLYGERILSPQGVSYLNKRLTKNVDRWHRRALKDEYEYIYFDGMVQGVKESVRRQRTVLVAYGIKLNGKTEVIDYAVETGESVSAWSRFLQSLYERGLTGENLKLIIHDGSNGLIEALNWLWPNVKRQLCAVHKLRNLSSRIKTVHTRKRIMREAAQIYKSENKQQAYKRIQKLKNRWEVCEPKAIRLFLKNIEDTLTYFDFPKELWDTLKSTNPIERYLEEWRRRLKTMRCLNNVASCDRIIYGQVIEYNSQQEDIPNNKIPELILT